MGQLSVDIRLAQPGFTLSVAHEFEPVGNTALFGRSGAGKSSLLRVIAGFERAADGRVTYDNWDWQATGVFEPPHRRGVGYVFQDTRLFDHLSVEGNLRYAARRAPTIPNAIRREDVIDALDLAPLLGRRPATLSGGEKQRVAIGRTLLTQPRLLLLDEPLAALDMRAKSAILPLIARLPAAFSVPIIHVTHALEEVTQLADRMVVLDAGKVVASGGVADCLERMELLPATGRFEASSILEGTVAAHDPELHITRLTVGPHKIEMPGVSLPVGENLRLRVRARDVSLAVARPDGISIRNILEGRVTALTPEPDTAFTEVLVDIGTGRLRARITRASVSELGLSEGVTVYALVKSVSFDRRAMQGW